MSMNESSMSAEQGDKRSLTEYDLTPEREVTDVIRGWTNAEDYYVRRRRRSLENWRMYWAHDPELGLGQWPEDAVNFMLEQDRQLIQYNFVKVIIDTLAGGIMQLPFDPEYYPVNEELTSLTKAIKSAMYSDKELLDWKTSYLELVRDGLIQEGVMKMVVSRKWDELGNIGFERCLPNSVYADPYWKTWSSRDCKKCWHETWHTAEDLAEMFPEHADTIMGKLGKSAGHADEYGSYTGINPFLSDDYEWGDVYGLVSEYKMITTTVEEDVAITAEGEVILPRYLADKDKGAWLDKFHPSWRTDLVYTKETKSEECQVRSVCRSISSNLLLQKKPSEIQVGRLPYFFWAASRANGESHSIVDSVKDAQRQINYMSSLITHKIQIEGGGGAQFVDRDAFASDEEFQRYRSNRNDPSETFELKPGTLLDGKVPAQAVRKSGFPNEAYESINHIVKVILPNTSYVTPATRGMAQTSSESGKLFELMKIQSDQQAYTIHYGLRMFWNEVYEAYFMQATNTYSLEGVPRKFSLAGGKDSVTLNEKVCFPDGAVGIKNDVAMLKKIRHKVIIDEKQETPTEKAESLNTIGRFLKSIGDQSPLVSRYLIKQASVMMNATLDDEDREAIEQLADLDLNNAVTASEVQQLNLEMQKVNLSVQLKEAKKQILEQAKAKSAPPPQGMPAEIGPGATQGAPLQKGEGMAGPQGQPIPDELIGPPPASQGAPQGVTP